MPDSPRHRPAVTVSRPDGTRGAADVLQGGASGPVLGPRGRRRAALAATLALVLAVGAVTALRVRDARSEAAQETRTAGVVVLTVTEVRGGSEQIGGDIGALRFRLTQRISLRNDGPRPVTVTGAALGPYQARATPAIEPGRQQDVVLERLVVCPQAPAIPPVEPTAPTLAVDVQTRAGARQTRLPLPAEVVDGLPEVVQRACGVLTLSEGLRVALTGSQRQGTSVLVRLALGNATSQPARLIRLVVQQGLRSLVRTPSGGELPLDLPEARPGEPTATVPVEVILSVTSCRAIFQLTPAAPGQPSLDTLLLTIEDRSGRRTGPLEADLDLPPLRELVSDVC